MGDERVSQVTIWCNHPGCDTEFCTDRPAGEPDPASYEAAAGEAEAMGWQVDRNRHDAESVDFCPEHHLHEDVRHA